MLGWAGLSVHCQVLSFLNEAGLSARTYLLGKLLHGLLSACLAGIFASLLSANTPLGAFLAAQVGDLAELDFSSALRGSVLLSAGVLAGFLIVSAVSLKSSGKKR